MLLHQNESDERIRRFFLGVQEEYTRVVLQYVHSL